MLGAHPYHAKAQAAVAFSSTLWPTSRQFAASGDVEDRGTVVGDQLPEKLIKIGAKVVSHGGYVTFRMTELRVPR
jgi:hypothetical protein